jgi:hypothetical protein
VRRGGVITIVLAALSVVALLSVTALAGLRSPARTAALAAELAAEPAVNRLVADAVIEGLLTGVEERVGPFARLLLPVVRPGIERFVRAAVASPAGRAALASALTDTIRHLTVRGPTVIDLRAALATAIAEAPPELEPTLRTLLDRSDAGLIVLGAGAGTGTTDATDTAHRPLRPGTVGGIPSRLAIALLLLLAAGLLAAIGARAAGITLLSVALPTGLVLWSAPELVILLLAQRLPDAGLVGALTPIVAPGVAGLLSGVRLLAGVLVVIGAGLLVASSRAGAEGQRPSDPAA